MPGGDDDAIDFELSEEDVKALSEAASEVVSEEPSTAETPYTIRNAPVAKSILRPEDFVRRLPPLPVEGSEDEDGDAGGDDRDEVEYFEDEDGDAGGDDGAA